MAEEKDKRDELEEEAEPSDADAEATAEEPEGDEEAEEAAAEAEAEDAEEPADEDAEAEGERAAKVKAKRKRRKRKPRREPLTEREVRDQRYIEMLEPVGEPLYMRLSVLGLLVGVLALFVGLVLYVVKQQTTSYVWAFVGAGAALVVYALVTSFQKIVMHAGRRGAKVGAHTVILTVLVLAVIVIVNWWGLGWEQRWDMTKQKVHSLAPLTVKQLKSIKADKPEDRMEILGFVSPGGGEKLRQLLKLYAAVGRKHVNVEIVDPIIDPARVKAAEEKTGKTISDGTVLVTYGDAVKDLSNPNERRLTSAIISLAKGHKPKVYFLAGHGEPALDGYDPKSYGKFKAALEAQNYEASELRLHAEEEPRVPDDCKVLVVAGAIDPVSSGEMTAISDWVAANGKLLLLLERGGPDFHEILADYDVEVGAGTVVSYTRSMPIDAETVGLLVDRVSSPHPVAEGVRTVIFGGPRIVEPTGQPPYPDSPYGPQQPPSGPATTIIESHSDAWEEMDMSLLDETGDRQGALSIAVAVEKSAHPDVPEGMPIPPEDPEKERASPKVRIVVVGDAEFAEDRLAGLRTRNMDLALNAIHWLAEETDLISIPPVDDTPKMLTLTGGQRRFAALLTIFIVPLAILAAGLAVWWRRR